MSRVSRWVGRRFAGRDTWGFAVRLELELPQLLAPGFLRPTTARSSLKCKRALVPVAQAGLFPVAQAGSGGSGRTKRFRGVKRFFSLSLSLCTAYRVLRTALGLYFAPTPLAQAASTGGAPGATPRRRAATFLSVWELWVTSKSNAPANPVY